MSIEHKKPLRVEGNTARMLCRYSTVNAACMTELPVIEAAGLIDNWTNCRIPFGTRISAMIVSAVIDALATTTDALVTYVPL